MPAESNSLLPLQAVASHSQMHPASPHSHFVPQPCHITSPASQPETANRYPWLSILSLIDFVFQEEFIKTHWGDSALPLLSPDIKTTFAATREAKLWTGFTCPLEYQTTTNEDNNGTFKQRKRRGSMPCDENTKKAPSGQKRRKSPEDSGMCSYRNSTVHLVIFTQNQDLKMTITYPQGMMGINTNHKAREKLAFERY